LSRKKGSKTILLVSKVNETVSITGYQNNSYTELLVDKHLPSTNFIN